MNIDIETTGSWPNSNDNITIALINNIVLNFMEMVDRTSFPKLLFMNEPNRECPMVAFDKVMDDRTLILLSSVRGSLWAKIAYQLSHELCHVHANYAAQRDHTFKWLEESLCELASICNLLKMSQSWTQSPPLEFMAGYAPDIDEYVQNVIADIDRPEQFVEWVQENLHLLKGDSCLRGENSIVALNLMPIFLRDNTAWKAVGYLNLWHVNRDDTIQSYFKSMS